MPYLIDGHNLIPKLGLSLRSVDDELELVHRLQAFCRLQRRQVDVFFDGAPPGQDGSRAFGSVTAHFVRAGTTADSAIRARLKQLGRAARNWTVVTSDREVQAAARGAGASVVSSDEFARQVIEVLRAGPPVESKERGMSKSELDEWLTLFRDKGR
ncbi:MAG: NYN domain-containing protein [Chloroflexota bacterium]